MQDCDTSGWGREFILQLAKKQEKLNTARTGISALYIVGCKANDLIRNMTLRKPQLAERSAAADLKRRPYEILVANCLNAQLTS
jgi:hypothetical protein